MQTPNTETDKCACADAIQESRRTCLHPIAIIISKAAGRYATNAIYINKSEDEATVFLYKMNELIRLSRE